MASWIDPTLVLFPTLAVIFAFIAVAVRHIISISFGSYRIIREHAEKQELLFHEQGSTITSTPLSSSSASSTEYQLARLANPEPQKAQMQLHKELYFKLQHLEQYPEILPQARDLLISLFSETLADALKTPKAGILSIAEYSREHLLDFQRKGDEQVLEQWEQYLAKRGTGAQREMFRDKEEAKWWLTQSAPVKYVDGAWLGHMNKITTPFALRGVMKDAWQVLSEELGDGDLEKNHVYIYRQLMKVAEPSLPSGDSADFIHPRHKLNEPGIWKAAVAQLLISLFPHQFLPEILGFNMHFEAVSLETLKVSRELKELNFDPYYFILHISIDNAHSGHTAMAVEAVIKYIQLIQLSYGDTAAQQAWTRVQAGYILSKGLPTAPVCPGVQKPTVPPFPRNELEAGVIKIFKAKAEVAHKVHCGSRIKIGRHTLVEWLEPSILISAQRQMEFLDDLSNTKLWICKGDSNKSRFMKELSWRGKMFGSFTQTEVHVIEQWINSLNSEALDAKFYWRFINQSELPSHRIFQHQDIRVDHPVFAPLPVNDLLARQLPSIAFPLPAGSITSRIIDARVPNLAKLFPLWFTHPCLLEHFICIPAKTTTSTACSVLRVLRAQSGFGPEGPIVSGIDEMRREESHGLVELGLQMVQRSKFPEPGCLTEVLDSWESEFGLLMLHLCKRPIEHGGVLLGLAMAFVDLHDAVARSSALLSTGSRQVLTKIATREREGLNSCLENLRGTSTSQFADFGRGYHLGRAEIEKCFESPKI